MNWPPLKSQQAITGMAALLMVVSLAAGFVAMAGAAPNNGNGVDHGNWSQHSGNFQNTGHIDTTGPTDNPTEVLNATVNGRVDTSPVVADVPPYENRTAYVGTKAGNDSEPHLYALDAVTGEVRWAKRNDTWVKKTPAVVDIAGFANKTLVTTRGIRDAVTGDQLCSFQTEAKATVTVHDGVVYYGSGRNVIAVDAIGKNNCPELWSRHNSEFKQGKVMQAPAVAPPSETLYQNATVYVPTRSKLCVGVEDACPEEAPFGFLFPQATLFEGRVIALDAETGDLRWTYGGAGGADVEPGSTACILENVIGLTDQLNCDRRSINGGAMDEVRSAPAVDNGTVYFGSMNGFVHAVDATTGTPEWKTKVTTRSTEYPRTSPAVYNGVVYAATGCKCFNNENDKVVALYATNGTIIDSTKTGTSEGPPAVVQDTVYVASADGQLYGLNANTLDIRWTENTGKRIGVGPAVLDGRVYVGNNDGNVIALAENQTG